MTDSIDRQALKPGDRVSYDGREGLVVPIVPDTDDEPDGVAVAFNDDPGNAITYRQSDLTLVARAQYAAPGTRLVEIDDVEFRAIEEARDRLRAAHQEWCEYDAPCRCSVSVREVDAFLARARAGDA